MKKGAVQPFRRAIAGILVLVVLSCYFPPAAAEEGSFIYTIELGVSRDRGPVSLILDGLPDSLRYRASLTFKKDRCWHLELGFWNSIDKAIAVLEEVRSCGIQSARLLCTEYEVRGCMRYAVTRVVVDDPYHFTPVSSREKAALAVTTSSAGDEMQVQGNVARGAQAESGTEPLSAEEIENSDGLVSAVVTEENVPDASGASEGKSPGRAPGISYTAGPVALNTIVAPSAEYEQIQPPSPDVDASHLGITGLLRVPNGRVINDGDLRLSASQGYPYQDFALTTGILPSVEANLRIDNLYTSPPSEPGVAINNLRSVDVKLQVLKESRWTPAVSVGVMDVSGEVRTFATQYVAASKRIGNLDITAGYGSNSGGSLFGTPSKPNTVLKGVFGGVQYNLSPKLSLIAEYDPTETYPIAGGKTLEVDNHCNVGVRYRPVSGVTIGAGQLRGQDLCMNIAFTYPFGAPLRMHKYDEPFYGPTDLSALDTETPGTTDRLTTIRNYLEKEGFAHTKLSMGVEDQKLGKRNMYVEYENTQYLSEVKALGRVLRVCVAQAPSDVEYIHVIMMNQNLPMAAVTVKPRDYVAFLNGVITPEQMKERIIISQDVSEQRKDESSGVSVGECTPREESLVVNPVAVEPFLNDLSGFFNYRVGPSASWEKDCGSGSSVVGFFRFPVYSNVTTARPPISDTPVRSDIVEYEKRTGIVVENLYYNQIMRVGKKGFARATLGYPEMQFAAASLEIMSPCSQGRLGIGGEVTYAVKRDPSSAAGLTSYNRVTPFLKAYAYFPKLEGVLEAQVGTYLAGDSGGTLRFTRYLRGGNIFVWYTHTNTSSFTGQNKNYDDRGIGFSLPLSVFKDHDCQGYYSSSIAPWTRDVGQDVYQPELKDFFLRFTPAYIFEHWNEILH